MTVEQIQLVATILQVFAFVALIVQLYLMHRERLVYHERTRKQATLEHAGPRWSEALFELDTRFGPDALAKEKAQDLFDDYELKAYVDKLLGTLEDISAGVNTQIYDADILYRMCATSIINSFNRFKSYIELRRQQESPEMYIELEAVAIRFADRRRKKPGSLGDIIHSKNA